MPDKYINLEELDQVTQSLLIKINEQSNLKVNKANVSAELDEGIKIGEIEGVELYAPEGLQASDLATVATSGSYYDLNDTPEEVDTSDFMVKGTDYVTAGQKSNVTIGQSATAEGYDNQATDPFSHAEGLGTSALCEYAHAEGGYTTASGGGSHAEGSYTTASGAAAHAEGGAYVGSTIKITAGSNSTTIFTNTIGIAYVKVGRLIKYSNQFRTITSVTSNDYSFTVDSSFGASSISNQDAYIYGQVSGNFAHGEGKITVASGQGSHAEGMETFATGSAAHAEGCVTTASGLYSHSEGASTSATGSQSHAEGASTIASNNSAHAEGYYTTASGPYSHAEGDHTTASQYSAHAEGNYTTASGAYSHAEGYYTTAQRKSQHVFGEYNILDVSGSTSTRGTYVEIVGNGTSSARSNARTLDWSGNEVLAGKLTLGAAPTANMDAATKQYVDTALSNIDLTAYTPTIGLAAVALSGSYNDLSNLPTIPAAETDANVEDMLDSYNLDYTSNSVSANMWSGGSY